VLHGFNIAGMRLRAVFILLSLIILVGFLAYRIELFSGTAPIQHLYASHAACTARNWLYDVLGYAVTKDEAANCFKRMKDATNCLQNGAVAVTEKLLALGREAFIQRLSAMKSSLPRSQAF